MATKNNKNNKLIQKNNSQLPEPVKDEIITHKRGRPKGSKNTVKVTRKDNIQNILPDDVKRKILAFNMALYKLPRITDKNDLKQISDRTDMYFNLCSEYALQPTLSSYSLSLGIDRRTLWLWLKDNSDYIKNPEVYHILKTAYDFINSNYEALLTEGKIVPVSGFFMLQNNYGYKNTTDHVITTVQDNNDNVTDISNRAGLLED